METHLFERKTFTVEAVQVSLENMPEVVRWTGGTLRKDDLHRPYVAVEVNRPANVKQTMAYEGDWVLKTATGFRIYTDHAFHKSFDPVREDRVPDPDPYQTKNIFDQPGIDRRVVVEKPVGHEKVVQGESVETVVVGEKDLKGMKIFRSPEELREAHRTGKVWTDGTEVLPADLDGGPIASDGTRATYLANYLAEHGHYPGENAPDA